MSKIICLIHFLFPVADNQWECEIWLKGTQKAQFCIYIFNMNKIHFIVRCLSVDLVAETNLIFLARSRGDLSCEHNIKIHFCFATNVFVRPSVCLSVSWRHTGHDRQNQRKILFYSMRTYTIFFDDMLHIQLNVHFCINR